MISELTTHIRLAGETMFRFILWPGEWLLAHVADIAPGVAEAFALHPGNTPLLYAVSLLVWLAVIHFIRSVVRFVQNILRLFDRVRTFLRFRMSMAMTFGKRRVDGLYNALRIWRHPEEAETPHVVFESLDIAVLDAITARGTGFAVSAPELAEQMGLRPSQAQQSLDKLCSNFLLQRVIGSTDGYDNYGITSIGDAFMQSWLRQTSPNKRPRPIRPEPKSEQGFIPDGLHLSS